jgi:hypothetical protein
VACRPATSGSCAATRAAASAPLRVRSARLGSAARQISRALAFLSRGRRARHDICVAIALGPRSGYCPTCT